MSLIFASVDLVVDDVDAAVEFYRQLGVNIPDEAVWRPNAKAAHHVGVEMPNGIRITIDSQALTTGYATNWKIGAQRSSNILIFEVPTRDDVDALYARITADGHAGLQEPFDAFWGARYAMVNDPAGNNVGIMSPSDGDHGPGPELTD